MLVVTRPEPQCQAWVARLQSLGQPACALPLLRIEAVPEFAAALDAAWAALAAQRLVMFVSPNAVERFFACRPAAMIWPAGVLAGATGPGTVAALRARGVSADAIAAPSPQSAQFDADALWRDALAPLDWSGARVLVVRGEAGRDWLAQTLRAHGATVQMLAAYRQAAPLWSAPECAALAAVLAAPQRHAWLFSSSQAVHNLKNHLQSGPATADQAWTAARAVPALATHPRIAETASAAGWLHVCQVRPEIEQVVAALQNPVDTMPATGCQSCPPSL
jgi:uroporphyrinogen-III synthase